MNGFEGGEISDIRSKDDLASAAMPTAEATPSLNFARLHDHFPAHRIRDCAKRLSVIVDAWQAGVGGPEGVPHLLIDAVNAAEDIREYLTEWSRAYGVTTPDGSRSISSYHIVA